MRTTITIEDDVAARLAQLSANGRESFKQLVNRVLRAGLDQLEEGRQPDREPYRIEPFDAGPAACSLDNVAEVLAVYEAESWK